MREVFASEILHSDQTENVSSAHVIDSEESDQKAPVVDAELHAKHSEEPALHEVQVFDDQDETLKNIKLVK